MADLDAYERKLNALLASVDRLTATELRASLESLAAVRRELVERMVQAAAGNQTYTTTVLNTLLADVNRIGAEYDARLRRHMTATLRQAWDIGARALPDALAAAGIETTFAIGLDSRLLQIATGLSSDLITRVSQGFIADVSKIIRLGALGGISVNETMKRVEALLATNPARGLGTIAQQAEVIVRTEIMRAYSLANEARTREAADLIPGLRKYWLATPDRRTREDHMQAWARYRPGGSIGPIPVDADYVVGGERAKYPYDPRLSARQTVNCRCRSVMWSDEWNAKEEAAA